MDHGRPTVRWDAVTDVVIRIEAGRAETPEAMATPAATWATPVKYAQNIGQGYQGGTSAAMLSG
jgi:hypothetical protein